MISRAQPSAIVLQFLSDKLTQWFYNGLYGRCVTSVISYTPSRDCLFKLGRQRSLYFNEIGGVYESPENPSRIFVEVCNALGVGNGLHRALCRFAR